MILIIVLVLLRAVATIAHRNGAYSWYSTIGDFKKLSWEDNTMLDQVETRVKAESLRINKLLEEMQDLRRNGKMILVKYFVEKQLFISAGFSKRYQVQWNRLKLDLETYDIDEKFVRSVADKLKTFPQEDDITASYDALLDIQEVYGLTTNDLAEGIILRQRSSQPISPASCYGVAMRACESGKLPFCQEWTAVAAAQVKSDGDGSIDIDHLLREMNNLKEENDFKALCLDAAIHSNVSLKLSNLKCVMWNNYDHPWLILQPVPMEYVTKSPDVVVFHNVISDQDIEYLKQSASSNLGSAKTLDEEESLEVNSTRVAHNCWLDSANDSTLSRLDEFISAITGLDLDGSSEMIQVANYGIAGHYYPHKDVFSYSPEDEIIERNRKATFMFYLSDVEHGGATVFVHSSISIKPMKGSAVFWHNLLPSGAPDGRTVHGSCPVILGNKWVANKWIWETDRELCKTKEYIGRIHN